MKYKKLTKGNWYSWNYRAKNSRGKYLGRYFNKKIKSWVYHFQTGPGTYATLVCKQTKNILET